MIWQFQRPNDPLHLAMVQTAPFTIWYVLNDVTICWTVMFWYDNVTNQWPPHQPLVVEYISLWFWEYQPLVVWLSISASSTQVYKSGPASRQSLVQRVTFRLPYITNIMFMIWNCINSSAKTLDFQMYHFSPFLFLNFLDISLFRVTNTIMVIFLMVLAFVPTLMAIHYENNCETLPSKIHITKVKNWRLVWGKSLGYRKFCLKSYWSPTDTKTQSWKLKTNWYGST